MKTTIRENGRERTIYHGPGYPIESRPADYSGCFVGMDLASAPDETALTIRYADEARVMTEDQWILLLENMQRRTSPLFQSCIQTEPHPTTLKLSAIKRGNSQGWIRDRAERTNVVNRYQRWLRNVKEEPLPALTKCASEVTPMFMPVLEGPTLEPGFRT